LAVIDDQRSFFAKAMACASRSSDPRLERTFELVPREAFLGNGPWKTLIDGRYVTTPSADPSFVYQNNLVALDASKGINNGEPFLHARWIGAVSPQAGETITHIGVGSGYYTAILSMLVRPGGRVIGIEIEQELAVSAQRNLEPFDNASVIVGDAVCSKLEQSDVIYINAGVAVPPTHWLRALQPGGRMVFPWRPSQAIGLAVLATRHASGFSLETLMPAWFIACAGAATTTADQLPASHAAAWQVRSLHLVADRTPDDSAVACYPDIWFSHETLPGDLNASNAE